MGVVDAERIKGIVMRPRVSLLLFTLALLLTAVTIGLLHQRSVAPPPVGRAISFPLSVIESMELYRGETCYARFSLHPEKGWEVEIPELQVRDVADSLAVEDLLAFIQRVYTQPVHVTRQDAGLADLSKAIQFVVSSEGANESVFLGRLTADGRRRYFLLDRAPEVVHVVDASLTRVFDREATSLRSLDLFDLRNGPERLILHPGGSDGENRAIIFERSDRGWVITQPVRWPAEPEQIERLLRLCQMLRAREVMAERASDLSPFGLGPEAPRVIVRVGGKDQTVRFGNSCPSPPSPSQEGGEGEATVEVGGVYAIREGRDPIYRVSESLLRETTQNEVRRYRRLPLDLLEEGEPTTIEIIGEEGTLSLTLRDQTWVASGARTFPIEQDEVKNLLMVLRHLSVLRFVSETRENAATWGLDPPFRHIHCMDAGGRQLLGLALSRVHPDGHAYATVEGRPQIVEIQTAIATMLLRPYIHFRTRNVGGFDFRLARTITIQTREGERVFKWNIGSNWQLYRPETLPLEEDALSFFSLVRKLGRIRCLDYVEEDPTDLSPYGLDLPRIRVIVSAKKTEALSSPEELVLDLRIGNEIEINRGEGGPARVAFARLDEQGPVFLLDDTWVQMLVRPYR